MPELTPEAEATIAAMTEGEFDLLVARTRPPEEPADPKVGAANALRRNLGLDNKTHRASKDTAAALLRADSTGKA